ncbi:MAG: hypothetical protein ABI758_05385 [Candidatus Woesebacteria bacterium]
MKQNSGQTLIEVIIATGLVVLVLTTLVSGVALGIRNNRYAKDSALSKEYVREAAEWLRGQRDLSGWGTFANILQADASGNTVNYCLDTLPAGTQSFSTKGSSTCSGSQKIVNKFTRQMTIRLTGSPPVQADATITVTWVDGTRTFTSTSTVSLYQWK